MSLPSAASKTALPTRNLNVLRAFAVLAVVADHVAQLYTDRIGPLTVWELGRLGVLLFFVHTTLVLMSSIERQGQHYGWVRAFYVRRAYRIYPLAVVCILGYLLFHIPPSVRSLEHPTPFVMLAPIDVLTNLALLQNPGTPLPITVLWSLPIEVQMYLTLPFCYVMARRGVGWVVALTAAAAVLWWEGHTYNPPGFWRLAVINYTPCFLAGVLAYALLRRRALRPVLPGWTWVPILLGLSIGLTAVLHPNDENSSMNWLVCLAVGLVIPFVGDARASWLTRGAAVVAKYSYGVYLTHVAALWLAVVPGHALPTMLQLAIFLGLTAAFSFFGYRFIEEPLTERGRKQAEAIAHARQRRSERIEPAP